MPASDIVLITIMRAGLPLLGGFQRIFDHAGIGFISSYRIESNSGISVKTEYMASPDLTGKTVMLIDTMLASGRSIADAVSVLGDKASPEGCTSRQSFRRRKASPILKKNLTQPASLWTFSIDEN